MINYHVKKSKRTRLTYRLLGIVVIIVCASQVVMFILGYGRSHKLGTILAFALLIYGIYLFINSFRPGAYNMDYEFRDTDFTVHTRYGDKVYKYSDITNLSHIIPENEILYSLIHITIGKTDYVLPFSLKKDVAEKIYNFLDERTCLNGNVEKYNSGTNSGSFSESIPTEDPEIKTKADIKKGSQNESEQKQI